MSKSDPSENSRINMTDGPETITRKIKKATTDGDLLPGRPEDLQHRPEARNLINIYAALADITIGEVCIEFEGKQFSVFKSALTDLAVSVLGPIGDEMAKLISDECYLDGVLKDGAGKAQPISEEVLDETEVRKNDLKELAEILSDDDLQILYQIGLIAKRDMELAPSLSSGFEMALLRMVSFLPGEVKDTKKKVEKTNKKKGLESKDKHSVGKDLSLAETKSVEETLKKELKQDAVHTNRIPSNILIFPIQL